MAETTAITWTESTFNPWLGCTKVSEGCRHCYAETLVTGKMNLPVWGPKATRKRTAPANWAKPVAWDRAAAEAGKRTRVFCASLCDVFEDHPDANAWRPDLWRLIRATPNLDWQLLTKRPERIVGCLPADWGPHGWQNVWLGTTIEDMRVAHRADVLRQIPAVVRFVSYEPALGPLDELNLVNIDWVIYGGESGPGFRPHDLAWPRSMKVKCERAGVAFFFKQSSAPRTDMGTTLDGETIRLYPEPRKPVRPAAVQQSLM